MDRIEIADKMKTWISNIEWWLGGKIVRFGWWIIIYGNEGFGYYPSYYIEKNGKKYSMEYVKGEKE